MQHRNPYRRRGVTPPYSEFFRLILNALFRNYGILPPLKGLGGYAAVAVSFADSSLPEGAEGSVRDLPFCR